jgi:hypothetical protein
MTTQSAGPPRGRLTRGIRDKQLRPCVTGLGGLFAKARELSVVVFATNSARLPSAILACDGLHVRYQRPALFRRHGQSTPQRLLGEVDAGSRGLGPGYAVESGPAGA